MTTPMMLDLHFSQILGARVLSFCNTSYLGFQAHRRPTSQSLGARWCAVTSSWPASSEQRGPLALDLSLPGRDPPGSPFLCVEVQQYQMGLLE